MKTVYDFVVKNTKGEEISLKNYEGKVILIVNTATKCGLATQFDGLEKLWKKFWKEKFVILGFPCNQFRDQEPETNDTVEEACRLNFGVTFPLFARIDVNGENEHPLYTFLKNEKPTEEHNNIVKDFLLKLATIGENREWSDIKWNFTKFLISKNGEVLQRFSPTTTPDVIEKEIEKIL